MGADGAQFRYPGFMVRLLVLMSETLNNLEQRLSPHGFVRVHRRHLVNARRIVAVHPMLGGTFVLQLRNGVRVGTGRQYKDTIRGLLNT